MKFIAYTDGACSNQQFADKRIGGCAYAVFRQVNGQAEKAEKAITVPGATNNQMELMAVLEALKFIHKIYPDHCDVEIRSDSQYVVSAVEEGWIDTWINNGWRTASREKVKNQELWEEFINLKNLVKLKFTKVQGHVDDKWNNHVDKLARKAAGSK